MSGIYRQPMAEVTLKVADEADKKLWVYETHDEVLAMIASAKARDASFITLERVKGIGSPAVEFSTQPSNVVNVRDISEA